MLLNRKSLNDRYLLFLCSMLESGIALFPDLTALPLHVSCKYKMLMVWINISHSTESRSVGNKDTASVCINMANYFVSITENKCSVECMSMYVYCLFNI